jgi:phosphopantothenoylcysteine decarboxylase/phosphopantothenate--cysteine ligase
MRILVTAGPTREFLDTVRFLSNASTGKMGYAIAAEAAGRGHDVVLASGPVTLSAPAGVDVVPVVSAAEMFEACVSRFDECQGLVMTAAVCDYRPATCATRKLKKAPHARSLDLEPTRDILAHLGPLKGDRVVIGFAMEDHNPRACAEAKLRRKACDAIVLNGPGNLGADSAAIEVLRADTGWSAAVSGTKAALAVVVVDLVETLAQLKRAALPS